VLKNEASGGGGSGALHSPGDEKIFGVFYKKKLQWRRQDLLPGGAKLEIRSWGTHGEL